MGKGEPKFEHSMSHIILIWDHIRMHQTLFGKLQESSRITIYYTAPNP